MCVSIYIILGVYVLEARQNGEVMLGMRARTNIYICIIIYNCVCRDAWDVAFGIYIVYILMGWLFIYGICFHSTLRSYFVCVCVMCL